MITFYAHNTEHTLPNSYKAQPKFRRILGEKVRELLLTLGYTFAKVEMSPAGVALSDAGRFTGHYKNLFALQDSLATHIRN